MKNRQELVQNLQAQRIPPVQAKMSLVTYDLGVAHGQRGYKRAALTGFLCGLVVAMALPGCSTAPVRHTVTMRCDFRGNCQREENRPPPHVDASGYLDYADVGPQLAEKCADGYCWLSSIPPIKSGGDE